MQRYNFSAIYSLFSEKVCNFGGQFTINTTIMLSERDLKQIADKGNKKKQIENQLNEFKTGFPFLRLEAAASVEHGIVATTEESRAKYE